MPDTAALRAMGSSKAPRDARALEALLRAPGAVRDPGPMSALTLALESAGGGVWETLDFVLDRAIEAPGILGEIPFLDGPGEVTLSQRKCLAILASAFHCTFTDRPSDNCISGPDLPSINFDELHGGGRGIPPRVAKLRMLLEYFEACRLRVAQGDALSRPIVVSRHRAERSGAADWTGCATPLAPLVMHDLGETIDEAKSMLRVDFANRFIGGGALAYGCVQEEIMFCLCPELIVTRLFCTAMRPDEAIVIVGAEQFSTPRGYAGSLEFAGPYQDEVRLQPNGSLDSSIVALDAVDYRGESAAMQYRSPHILRELTKAWAGFGVTEVPEDIATGNWGCGAFGGDPQLKSLVQWMAATRVGKKLHYFPWDNREVHAGLPELAAYLVERGRTVGELAHFLLADNLGAGPAYARVRTHFAL